MHPEIELEEDLNALLRQHAKLARLIAEDTEASRYEMGTRLFDELETLRNLNERQELEKVRTALELKEQQKKPASEGGRSSHQKQLTNCIEPSVSPRQNSGRSEISIR